MTTDVGYAALSLLLAVIFSGAEISFLSSNKLQLEIASREGSMTAKIMYFFVSKPEHLFCTSLLGNILSLGFSVFYLLNVLEALSPREFNHLTNVSSIFLFILVVTAMIVLVGYIIPKCWAMISPERVVTLITVPFIISYIGLLPFTYGIILTHRFFTRKLLRRKEIEHRPFFRITPLQKVIDDKPASYVGDERILASAMDFKTVKIRDCMIPRTEIAAVEITNTIDQLRKAFMDSGHSKIMIFKKNIDDIIGYCHSSSLFRQPFSIHDILIPVITAPETTPANELMQRFIVEKKNVAVVMDEFGGTAGIVSAEDIVDEIFGAPPSTESVEENLLEEQLDERTYRFNARLEIDYLNLTYKLGLPVGDYDTLGGLILAHTDNIPSVGEIIRMTPFNFTIQSIFSNRIGVVKITVDDVKNDENSASGEAS
ncbi:hemolysin family protein [Pseudochryseolinea flava]|uniref:Hemolysin n=1 Tax=Pseudochryseolinea flava TaxID=2059302 RepID=A0A364Y8I7_9BACT|nr:hemolysin family protein [Pseudochryseolinea flava]RAW03401.1 hemolysin [Pseudochryseolinea flava]